MGKADTQYDVSSQKPGLTDASQNQTAEYIFDILNSIQRIAGNKEMPMLAHLIGLAKLEAQRNCANDPA